MDRRIEKLIKFRQFLLAQIDGLTARQLNAIPPGYNNNIIWNLGHMICAQQGVCYIRAGLPVIVEDKYMRPFQTNTKPEGLIGEPEIKSIKTLLERTIDVFQADFDKKIFNNYTTSPNILKVYGITLNNIDDALEFLIYHDGVHSGTILALKHLV
ncbi:DinB family protein [Niabella beijingensis]|uniref:DinB family protein n=1 Tax=Niabella beijingensis TaxID=2872700 RepID=UPI001CBF73F0|nr:DinB family protein [Niabella beijingensis]MBZ4188121.1 DinB family protein [Niabella beijingensis]